MKIAIVGAGVSGLVTAHLLDSTHEVTVFEAAGYAGGHTNTVRVDTPNETHHVDTGFIVFNDRNYPNFERLLDRLGVAMQPSTMTFGVSDGRGDFEYTGSSPNGLFAKRAHLVTPWFHRMVADLARFNRAARELVRDRTGREARWPGARTVAGAAGLQPPVHRARDRAPGVGGVVGRPAADVVLPRPVPGRVLRQSRHAVVSRPAAVADRQRRLGSVRRGAAAAASGGACA